MSWLEDSCLYIKSLISIYKLITKNKIDAYELTNNEVEDCGPDIRWCNGLESSISDISHKLFTDGVLVSCICSSTWFS